MSQPNNPTPVKFGAYVERTPGNEAPKKTLSSEYDLQPAPPSNRFSSIEPSSNPTNPFSAFYQHPSTRSSLERAKADSRTTLPLTQSTTRDPDIDLEAGRAHSDRPPPPPPVILVSEELEKYNTGGSDLTPVQTRGGGGGGGGGGKLGEKVQVHELGSQVWPSRRELQMNAIRTKRDQLRKNWSCMSGLSRKQRLWVRVLIVLVVVAAAVGIGVGISRAVGGTTYVADGQTQKVPGRV